MGDSEDKMAGLVEIVGDEELAKSIVAAAKTSMGVECSAVDMLNIINFTQRMVKLAEFRKQLAMYLTDKMAIVAPNLSALIGDTVAARLISKVSVCIILSEPFRLHKLIISVNLSGWISNKPSKSTSIHCSDSWS
jgi:hypothetical protein